MKCGIVCHYLKRCANVRGEIHLTDDQQIGATGTGTTLARDIVATGNIDDVDAPLGNFPTGRNQSERRCVVPCSLRALRRIEIARIERVFENSAGNSK